MLANYHTHTTRCQHAEGEDRQYIEVAIRAGYKILGISDHCPWGFDDGYVSHIRMTPSQMDEYFSSFEQLKKEYHNDIQIYIGFEAEYIPSMIRAQEALFQSYPVDYLILGQHFLGQENKSFYVGAPFVEEDVLRQYVDLCLEGMSTGKYQYLAHPDLAYYTGDDKIYEKHMRRLCEGIKKMDGVLEVNVLGVEGNRNYPDERFWQIARETGNRVIIGIDAHSPEHLLPSPSLDYALQLCQGMEQVEEIHL